jgi:hypothetical protein
LFARQKLHDLGVVGDVQRNRLRLARDAGVAGRAGEPVHQRTGGKLPGQRVLAPAGTEEEDVHRGAALARAARLSERKPARRPQPASTAARPRGLLAAMPTLAAIALLLAAWLGPAAAGEYSFDNRPVVTFKGSASERMSPFPAGKRAAAVWNADACWRGCASDCNWRMEYCLRETDADACRPQLDACDRACLRSCRTRGGPLMGWLDF